MRERHDPRTYEATAAGPMRFVIPADEPITQRLSTRRLFFMTAVLAAVCLWLFAVSFFTFLSIFAHAL